MIICILGDAHSTHRQRFAQFYAQAGHQVHMISPQWVRLPSAQVHSVGWPHLGPLDGIRNLAAHLWLGVATLRLARHLNADVVEGHYISVTGLPAVLAAVPLRVLVTYGDDLVTDLEINPIQRWMVHRAVPRADLIFTEDYPSRIRQLLSLGAASDSIVIHNWGTEIERFHPDARSQRLRQQFLPHGGSLVVSLRPVQRFRGFASDQYDVQTLLEAIPQVISTCPATHFLLIGAESRAIQDLVNGSATLPSTTCVGRVPYYDLPAYLASADLLVDTYYPQRDKQAVSHNLGQGLMEAMSCGLATLVADRIGIQEAPHYPGAIYTAGDADALACQAIELLRDAPRRATMGALNRQVIERHYNWHTNMQEAVKLYRNRLKQ